MSRRQWQGPTAPNCNCFILQLHIEMPQIERITGKNFIALLMQMRRQMHLRCQPHNKSKLCICLSLMCCKLLCRVQGRSSGVNSQTHPCVTLLQLYTRVHVHAFALLRGAWLVAPCRYYIPGLCQLLPAVTPQTYLLLCAVKNANVLSPGCTVTYCCVGTKVQGMSSATSELNQTLISRCAHFCSKVGFGCSSRAFSLASTLRAWPTAPPYPVAWQNALYRGTDA